MINAETARFINQIQYGFYAVIYAFFVTGMLVALLYMTHDLDHPGKKQMIVSLGSLGIIVLLLFIWAGRYLY